MNLRENELVTTSQSIFLGDITINHYKLEIKILFKAIVSMTMAEIQIPPVFSQFVWLTILSAQYSIFPRGLIWIFHSQEERWNFVCVVKCNFHKFSLMRGNFQHNDMVRYLRKITMNLSQGIHCFENATILRN